MSGWRASLDQFHSGDGQRTDQGWVMDLGAGDRFILGGPYAEFAPGDYEATFEFDCADVAGEEKELRLYITDTLDRELAAQSIRQFPVAKEARRVRFSVDRSGLKIEFRIHCFRFSSGQLRFTGAVCKDLSPPKISRRAEVVGKTTDQLLAIERNNHLSQFKKRVVSQTGEEGVIEEIVNRLNIVSGWCVEFGAYDGRSDSNTWNLIKNHGWKSIQIEPFELAFKTLQKNYADFSDVHCINSFVEPSGELSLDSLLARTPLPREFDFLAIDIDGDDYHVWRECEVYRPKIVMIEFNPFIAADIHFVKPMEQRTTAAASLRAITELSKKKGYELICVVGGNAIFVRREFFSIFAMADNSPEAMFAASPEMQTKIFQGYDGTLLLAGLKKLVWKFQIGTNGTVDALEFSEEDIQALPRALRVFRPRLTYRNSLLEDWALRLEPKRTPLNQLLAFRTNVTSECGEDGILAELFNRLGFTSGTCVEVGANDGKTFSNTWSLLNKKGWTGLLLDKDAEACALATAQFAQATAVKVVCAEVFTFGINSLGTLFERNGIPSDFEFLCIDVEGNDYAFWHALQKFAPKVVMVDINPTIPNDVIFVQEDDNNMHLGSSLRAFVELADTKGYELVATTTWNAIFVRRDLYPAVGLTANQIDGMFYPVFETKIFQSMDSTLTLQGCDRLIRHNYQFDVERVNPLPRNLRPPGHIRDFGTMPSVFF